MNRVQEHKRVYAIAVCLLLLVGCVTTQTSQPAYLKILYGADAAYDASMSACASSYNSKLIGEPGKLKCIELGGYYVAARANAVKAIDTYNASKDASALDQVNYWVSYLLGLTAQIISELAKAGV
jgi:hypothetical protein